MGRPLNKKYFGNTNLGSSSTTADDGIGGRSVASVAITTPSTYTTRPTVTFGAPQVAGGVTATGTITSEAHTGVVSGSQTKAYQVGQVLTAAGGSTWTVATLTATTTLTGVVIAGTAGQFTCNAATLVVGQSVTISGTYGGTGSITGYTNPTTYYISATNGTTSFTLVSTYAAAIAGTGGAIVTAAGTPTGLTYTVNSSAATAATVTVLDRSSFTTLTGLNSGAQATTSVNGGVGAAITVTYRAKAVVITEPGSGYTSVTPTATQSVVLAAAVLTSGVGAMIVTAYIPAANGGSSAVTGDIVKQTNRSSYKVKTAQGTGICKLVAAAPGAGEMTLTATDVGGKTYYVTKLTAHRATLIPYGAGGHIYTSGQSAQWSFDAASGTIVQIANN